MDFYFFIFQLWYFWCRRPTLGSGCTKRFSQNIWVLKIKATRKEGNKVKVKGNKVVNSSGLLHHSVSSSASFGKKSRMQILVTAKPSTPVPASPPLHSQPMHTVGRGSETLRRHSTHARGVQHDGGGEGSEGRQWEGVCEVLRKRSGEGRGTLTHFPPPPPQPSHPVSSLGAVEWRGEAARGYRPRLPQSE